jgi:hypothetical protein
VHIGADVQRTITVELLVQRSNVGQSLTGVGTQTDLADAAQFAVNLASPSSTSRTGIGIQRRKRLPE